MRALLDTSIVIGLEQGRLRPPPLVDAGLISVVTVEELYLGVLMASALAGVERRGTFERTLAAFEVLAVDEAVATASAAIRADGRRRGVRYAPFDSLIGATARVHGLPLVTQDEGMLGMLGVDVRVV